MERGWCVENERFRAVIVVGYLNRSPPKILRFSKVNSATLKSKTTNPGISFVPKDRQVGQLSVFSN